MSGKRRTGDYAASRSIERGGSLDFYNSQDRIALFVCSGFLLTVFGIPLFALFLAAFALVDFTGLTESFRGAFDLG